MRNDITGGLSQIDYVEIPTDQQQSVQAALARGNRVVDRLARRYCPEGGRLEDFRNTVRRAILTGDAPPAALAAAREVTPDDYLAVCEVEELKWRVVQGHVRKLQKIVSQKMAYARFFRATDSDANLKDDLEGEGLLNLLHAIYTYMEPATPFINFMTKVVHNRLTDHCRTKYPQITLSEGLSDRIRTYYTIQHAYRAKGVELSFEGVVRRMVENDLRESGERLTDRLVDAELQQREEAIQELRQALKQTVPLADAFPAPAEERDEEALAVEVAVAARLSPLQRAVLLARVRQRPFKDVAQEFGVRPQDLSAVFKRVKAEVGARLGVAG